MQKVVTYIKEVLLSQITRVDVYDSLNKIFFKTDVESISNPLKHFLICLSIDLKAGLLKPDQIINILNDINYKDHSKTFLTKFDETIFNNQLTKFHHCQTHESKNIYSGAYITVLKWSKMYDKIRQNLTKKNMTNVIDLEDEPGIFNQLFFERSLRLDHISEWCGWKNITWILPIAEFTLFLDSEDPVHTVINRLGIDAPVDPSLDKLLYIHYPSNYLASCYQPTTLCGWWLKPGGRYLSCQSSDGFGRTYSTTGTHKISAKERIFNHLDYGSSECSAHLLGVPNSEIVENSDTLIEAALERFDAIVL